jgi:hypothetical protein
MHNTRDVAGGFAKEAIWPFTPFHSEQVAHAHGAAQKKMLCMALASLGIGAAARGAQGMHNLFKRTTDDEEEKDKIRSYSPRPVEMEVPVAKAAAEKRAIRISGETTPRTDSETRPYGIAPTWLPNIPMDDDDLKSQQQGTKQAQATEKKGFVDVLGYLRDAFTGKHATKPSEIPYYWVGMPTLGAAGLYGGYKGLDFLLDRMRREGQKEELEEAREKFRGALRGSARQPKVAGDAGNDLGDALDRLFDQYTKRASSLEKQGNISGTAAGLYSLYAVLSSLLSGSYIYEQSKKRSKSELLEHAQKRRLRQRYQVRPPEIMATPLELSPSKKKKKEEEETPQVTDVPEPVEM